MSNQLINWVKPDTRETFLVLPRKATLQEWEIIKTMLARIEIIQEIGVWNDSESIKPTTQTKENHDS